MATPFGEAVSKITGLKIETVEDLGANGWTFREEYNKPHAFIRNRHILDAKFRVEGGE